MAVTEQQILEYVRLLIEFAYNNPEVTSTIIAGVVTYLYRYKFKGNWPGYFILRRTALPLAQKTIGARYPIEFTRKIRDNEIVGEYDIHYKELHKQFRDHGRIYPNNFAKLKWMESDNGSKNWEVGSWAYRPKGLLGKFQVHLMVYATTRGTTMIAAHYELSPLASPIRHYFGGGVFDAERGVMRAKMIMGAEETSGEE